jgi:hypothetical protein
MSCYQNFSKVEVQIYCGQVHVGIVGNDSIKSKFHDEIKTKLQSENVYYHSAQNHLSSRILSRNLQINKQANNKESLHPLFSKVSQDRTSAKKKKNRFVTAPFA